MYRVLLFLPSFLYATKLSTVAYDELTKTNIDIIVEEHGAFAVTGLPQEYTEAVQTLQALAPHCLQDLPTFTLQDGSKRSTFARENGQEYLDCLETESRVINKYFTNVDNIVSSLIVDMIGSEAGWVDPEGDLTTAEYKEHLHVYTHQHSDHEELSVPYHTDNGLMLMLTHFQQHPLIIRTKTGDTLETDILGDDSIIIILGSALPDWLLRHSPLSSRFQAAAHAVPSLSSNIDSRTVLARMKVTQERRRFFTL